MGTATYASIVTSIIVAAVILGAGIFPFIDNLTAGETIEVSNEGASWIRMAYITDQSDYSAEYSLGDDGITVAGQTGEYGDMILYADSKNTLCIIDDQIVRITGNEYTIYGDDVTTFTVSRTNGVVSFDDYATSESVEWAYVPTEGGVYGSFAPDTLPLNRYNSALAAVGGFAGIYAYNENLTYDAGLVMDADVTNKVINSVKWALPTAEPEEPEPLDIDPLDIDPLDIDPSTWQPIDIDPINPFQPEGNQLMAVPTPTYTDGDWGFDLDSGYAKIVSYSGAGGNITVPTTLTSGGVTYTVSLFGKGSSNSPVFDNSNITDFTLTFPSGWGNWRNQINSYACVQCTHLKAVTIDADLPYGIGISAFRGCTGLQSIVINTATLISLSDSAFEGCTSLTSYPFEKTKSYGGSCFKGCTAFEDVTLNLTNSGSRLGGAFQDCTGLKSASITITNSSSLTVGGGIFRGCTSLESVYMELPSTYTLTAINIFYGCTSLKDVTLVGWSAIPERTFYECTALEEFEISASVTSIGLEAFRNCTSLGPSFVIPDNVTTAGTNVFQGCTSLESVTLPESWTTIQGSMFRESGIKSVPNADNIVSIGNYAFRDSGLEGILVISESVTSIGMSAFSGCSDLSYLIVKSDVIPTAGNQYNPEMFEGTGISQVLNFSENEWTVTSYGLNAEEVRSDIEADSYLSVVHITESTTKEGAVFDIVGLIPLALVAGFLLIAVWVFIKK